MRDVAGRNEPRPLKTSPLEHFGPSGRPAGADAWMAGLVGLLGSLVPPAVQHLVRGSKPRCHWAIGAFGSLGAERAQ